MSFANFAEIANHITEAEYGLPDTDIDEGAKRVLKDVRLSDVLLLRFAQQVDELLDACMAKSLERLGAKWQKQINARIDEFVNDRVAKHGECPKELLRMYRKQCEAHIGWLFVTGNLMDGWGLPPLRPPKKGSPERKTYEMWMKTKPAKRH